MNPSFADAYVSRGLLQMALKDIDQAIADYSQAIAYYDRALRLDSRRKDVGGKRRAALIFRSAAWEAKGNNERAKADAAESLRGFGLGK